MSSDTERASGLHQRRPWYQRWWNRAIIWSWKWRYPDYDGTSEANEKMMRGMWRW